MLGDITLESLQLLVDRNLGLRCCPKDALVYIPELREGKRDHSIGIEGADAQRVNQFKDALVIYQVEMNVELEKCSPGRFAQELTAMGFSLRKTRHSQMLPVEHTDKFGLFVDPSQIKFAITIDGDGRFKGPGRTPWVEFTCGGVILWSEKDTRTIRMIPNEVFLWNYRHLTGERINIKKEVPFHWHNEPGR